MYDTHQVGLRYDTGTGRWAIYNLGWAAMPTRAASNVLAALSGPGSGSTALVHTVAEGNTPGHITFNVLVLKNR